MTAFLLRLGTMSLQATVIIFVVLILRFIFLKLHIAKKHLVPKQRKRNGLTYKNFKIDDGAIFEIIDSYTSEAGVRQLERVICSALYSAPFILTVAVSPTEKTDK